jgi:hypothetical protein
MGTLMLATMLALSPVHGAPGIPANTTWLVWTSRVEGASVNVEEAARQLASTADEMHRTGRVEALSLLVSDALKLRRRVSSAALAVQVPTQD